MGDQAQAADWNSPHQGVPDDEHTSDVMRRLDLSIYHYMRKKSCERAAKVFIEESKMFIDPIVGITSADLLDWWVKTRRSRDAYTIVERLLANAAGNSSGGNRLPIIEIRNKQQQQQQDLSQMRPIAPSNPMHKPWVPIPNQCRISDPGRTHIPIIAAGSSNVKPGTRTSIPISPGSPSVGPGTWNGIPIAAISSITVLPESNRERSRLSTVRTDWPRPNEAATRPFHGPPREMMPATRPFHGPPREMMPATRPFHGPPQEMMPATRPFHGQFGLIPSLRQLPPTYPNPDQAGNQHMPMPERDPNSPEEDRRPVPRLIKFF